MYTIVFSEEAIEGVRALKKSNLPSFKKLSKLIEELKIHPFEGTGHPEPLVHMSGLWSRRIDKKNRLLYTVKDEEILVIVVSVLGHYNDK